MFMTPPDPGPQEGKISGWGPLLHADGVLVIIRPSSDHLVPGPRYPPQTTWSQDPKILLRPPGPRTTRSSSDLLVPGPPDPPQTSWSQDHQILLRPPGPRTTRSSSLPSGPPEPPQTSMTQ
ncbi:unnamed protein product [Boreogadus saida]